MPARRRTGRHRRRPLPLGRRNPIATRWAVLASITQVSASPSAATSSLAAASGRQSTAMSAAVAISTRLARSLRSLSGIGAANPGNRRCCQWRLSRRSWESAAEKLESATARNLEKSYFSQRCKDDIGLLAVAADTLSEAGGSGACAGPDRRMRGADRARHRRYDNRVGVGGRARHPDSAGSGKRSA